MKIPKRRHRCINIKHRNNYKVKKTISATVMVQDVLNFEINEMQ